MDIRQYLSESGITWKEVRRPSGKQAVFNCPSCGEKDFALSLDDGAFNCVHQGKCGISGSWYDFQRLLGSDPKPIASDRMIYTKPRKSYEKPKERPVKQADEPVMEFMRSRGFKDNIVKMFDVSEYNNAIVFDYIVDGEVITRKYRGLKEKKFWREPNTAPALYNMTRCDNNDTLYICEGELDAIAMKHYDIDAVSIPSGANDTSWIEHNWDWLEQFKKIYLIYDNDTAGQDQIKTIANRLGKWRCYNVVLPLKDPNECLLHGIPGDVIYHAIAQADEFSIPQVKRAGDYIDEVCDYITNTDKLYGIPTKHDGLNRILRGWRENEITLWTGFNGSGKSSIINEEMLHLANTGNPTCILSLELPPKKYLRWMIMQDTGFENIQPDHIKKTLTRLNDYLYIVNIVGSVKPDKLFSIFEFVARKYGVKHFLVDSLMLIEFKAYDEYTQQKQFVASLCEFTKEFDCHVHLVAHPRKGGDDNQKPDKVDVAGSGNITNMVDNVIAVWRPTEESKRAQSLSDNYLFVKKHREWGSLGEVTLKFHEHSKRFTEV